MTSSEIHNDFHPLLYGDRALGLKDKNVIWNVIYRTGQKHPKANTEWYNGLQSLGKVTIVLRCF